MHVIDIDDALDALSLFLGILSKIRQFPIVT
jgi:hypothetical protein